MKQFICTLQSVEVMPEHYGIVTYPCRQEACRISITGFNTYEPDYWRETTDSILFRLCDDGPELMEISKRFPFARLYNSDDGHGIIPSLTTDAVGIPTNYWLRYQATWSSMLYHPTQGVVRTAHLPCYLDRDISDLDEDEDKHPYSHPRFFVLGAGDRPELWAHDLSSNLFQKSKVSKLDATLDTTLEVPQLPSTGEMSEASDRVFLPLFITLDTTFSIRGRKFMGFLVHYYHAWEVSGGVSVAHGNTIKMGVWFQVEGHEFYMERDNATGTRKIRPLNPSQLDYKQPQRPVQKIARLLDV